MIFKDFDHKYDENNITYSPNTNRSAQIFVSCIIFYLLNHFLKDFRTIVLMSSKLRVP